MNGEAPAGRSVAADDEIDLVELVRALWGGRWIIAGVTAGTVLLAILYLNVATYTYTARLTLTPAQSSGSTLSSKLGGLGDLASLAGINMPQDSNALAFSLYVEGVHSRSLADAMARHNDLMRVIFHRDWNAASSTWQEPKGFVRTTATTVKHMLGIPVFDWSAPDGARLQEFMDEEVGVEQDPKKPFVTITFDHEDPAFATRFLSTLNSELDNLLRQKALARANGNIEYLSIQLGKVTIAEHREALAQALSEQEKQRMAASSSAPYAADPFGTATASARPTAPRPVLVLGAASFAGLLLGILCTLVLAAATGRKKEFTRRGGYPDSPS
jgi:hypothetical protein